MPYAAKDYANLIGMKGFSEALLKNHFTLYQGYVKNTNKLLDDTVQLCKADKSETPDYAEQKRRFGWEFDGMRLHELYFGNLGGTGPLDEKSELGRSLVAQFGSVQAWEKDFKAVGMMRGIGWAILYQDPLEGRLINCWINEHDTGHPAGCIPLLVLDVFEHAFMLDYQLKKSDYIAAFMQNVKWSAVEGRMIPYREAMKKAG